MYTDKKIKEWKDVVTAEVKQDVVETKAPTKEQDLPESFKKFYTKMIKESSYDDRDAAATMPSPEEIKHIKDTRLANRKAKRDKMLPKQLTSEFKEFESVYLKPEYQKEFPYFQFGGILMDVKGKDAIVRVNGEFADSENYTETVPLEYLRKPNSDELEDIKYRHDYAMNH